MSKAFQRKKQIAGITAICLLATSVPCFGTGISSVQEAKAAEDTAAVVKKVNVPVKSDGMYQIPGIQNPDKASDAASAWSGSRVRFGHYYDEKEDSEESSGVMSPIIWRILSADTSDYGTESMLLFSDKILEFGPYNNEEEEASISEYAASDGTITWTDSMMRELLNNAFFDLIFDEPVQGAITKSTKDASSREDILTDGESSKLEWDDSGLSDDRLFFLSAEEILNEEYGFFPAKEEEGKLVGKSKTLQIGMTDHAARSAEEMSIATDSYWLRSGTNDNEKIVIVSDDQIKTLGASGIAGLVPALNVDLSKIVFTRAAGYDTSEDVGLVSPEDADDDDIWDIVVQGGDNFTAQWNGSKSVSAGEKCSVNVTKVSESEENVEYEQISALLVNDETKEVVSYGKIKNGAEKGKVTFDIPDSLENGNYTIEIFAENVTEQYASNQATFEIKIETAGSAATQRPSLAPKDTEKPSTEPTDTEAPAVEPTKPAGTVEPTKVPDATTEPTKAPDATTEPTETPDNTTEPTKPTATPPAQNTEIDMEKAGEKITVGDVVYKSTGSNSVAYAGNKNAGKSVTVPDTVKVNGKSYPVTELSAGAFSGSKVQKVSLGKNVEKIGKGAFKNCKQLKKVSFPSNMQTLGAESFSGCAKLGSVALPASVKSVGARAFKNCKSMKKLSLGKKPAKTKSGKIMFGATGATKVSIGANALENCLNLRSVIINSQVTKIGNSTFKNCKKLASMLVKSLKLKRVGNQALKGVSNCKISVPSIRLKKYRTLFKNKGQGKKVVVAKV